MVASNKKILVINGGSSGIKFAVYNSELSLNEVLSGNMEGIGTTDAFFNYRLDGISEKIGMRFSTQDIDNVADFFVNRLQEFVLLKDIVAIGYRMVYDVNNTGTVFIDEKLIQTFSENLNADPEHFPLEINLIKNLQRHFSDIPHIACFDSSFHHTMPAVATLIPLPQKLITRQIHRHGFHGISYSFLLKEMQNITEKATANGKIIMAHLGSGASVCAVREGKCLDTSMGFSPVSGLPMATRTGDLDPGLIFYLLENGKITPAELYTIISHESGLTAISGTTGDIQKLLKIQHEDKWAELALDYFCYQTKKYIASYTAVLDGLETLIFSGGIGENSPEIRRRICRGLKFLGIELDNSRNESNDPIISTDHSKICVRVIPTNEQIMIASSVFKMLQLHKN